MRYLVKVFDAKRREPITKFTPRIVTDEGDEKTEGSLWFWLWESKRHGVDISVYRLTEDISKTHWWEQLIITNPDGSFRLIEKQELKTSPVGLLQTCHAMECILDLS